ARVLRIDEVGDESDVVEAEPGARHQRGKVVPRVEELRGRIRRQLAGLTVHAADAGGEEELAGDHQVRRDRTRCQTGQVVDASLGQQATSDSRTDRGCGGDRA